MSTPQEEPQQTKSEDSTSALFHQLSAAKAEAPPTMPPATRRTRFLTGIILGGFLGLASGLTTAILARTVAPVSPIVLYPLGLSGNVLLGVIIGIVIGGLCAIPAAALDGVIAGCFTTAAALVLRPYLKGTSEEAGAKMGLNATTVGIFETTASILQIGLIAVLSLPFILLLRRAIDDQSELAYMPLGTWKRLRFPVLVVGLVVAFTAIVILYPIY